MRDGRLHCRLYKCCESSQLDDILTRDVCSDLIGSVLPYQIVNQVGERRTSHLVAPQHLKDTGKDGSLLSNRTSMVRSNFPRS
jgi:hypothetical protein